MTQDDDIIRAARKAGIAKHGLGLTCWEGQLERFAALVATAAKAEEREACAKVAEWEPCITHTPQRIAAAIRARGQQ